MTSLAVLIACFNRRETTLRCLESLSSQTGLDDVDLRIFVVDDRSTDGTSSAVRERFPKVTVIDGTGDLYWTGGMLIADTAARQSRPDLLLWLNDDVDLNKNALRVLLDAADATHHKAIVVGAVSGPFTDVSTYGGYRRPDPRRPMEIVRVEPTGQVESLDTMNGNVVLVPAAVRESLGPLDGQFSHNMADMDYGYRALKAGWKVVLASAFIGRCLPNLGKRTWQDPEVPIRTRWSAVTSFRALPPREWLVFTRRHCGWRWPRYFVSPYVRCLTCGVSSRTRRS